MSDQIDREAIVGQRWLAPGKPRSGSERVYRPETSSAFEPTRSIVGFELKDDGTLVEIGSGADDRTSKGASGSWTLEGETLHLHFPSQRDRDRTLQIRRSAAADSELEFVEPVRDSEPGGG